METRSRDTTADVERIRNELLRRMPPWQKLALVSDAVRTSRRLVMAGLRTRFPEETPEQLHKRLRALILGEELAARVWGRSENA